MYVRHLAHSYAKLQKYRDIDTQKQHKYSLFIGKFMLFLLCRGIVRPDGCARLGGNRLFPH